MYQPRQHRDTSVHKGTLRSHNYVMRTLHHMSPGLLSFQITGSDLTEQYLRKQRHRTVALFYYLFTVSWWSHSLHRVVFPNYRICFNKAVTAETVIGISSTILLPLYYVTLIA